MFRRILIANRGEIACRVIATARRLGGIAAIAVYSEADAHARHVDLADEAWPIGPAPARDSYLDIARIIEVARRSGAEAVHPGYGFLSENADFAEACAAAGVAFIGPPAAAIRAMGSKAAAKALMQQAGVPVVPGFHGAAQDTATLADAAARIGYPVLVKASAGGGGKGMRVVEQAGALQAAIDGARREALSSFGDDRLLIERYLAQPRHIEIQVFADRHGGVVSLFERDCSIQRRHQKVLEEALAPGMDPARRAAMGEAACAAARAVGYAGAGTVEFIADADGFHFMEMNTRLQVEHPVTEMVTGLDLVEWQLRIAAGERLPLSQAQLGLRGHAIEARVYAEDPARDFLPSIGTLLHLRQPRAVEGRARVDTGVREGDAITPYYDPMIAKLIAWGEDRAAALQRLRAALDEYEVVGVSTNLDLLRAIAAHPDFAAGGVDTGFIARHPDLLAPPARRPDAVVWAAAALALLAAQSTAAGADDPWSPWAATDAWRLNGEGFQDLTLRHNETTVTVRAYPQADGSHRLDLPDGTVHAAAAIEADGTVRLRVAGVARRAGLVRRADGALVVIVGGASHVLHPIDRLAPPRHEQAGDDRLVAPIPARVARVLARPGDAVRKGMPLVVLEAMKMELTLAAPRDGVIASVRYAVDEMVEEGTEVVVFRTG